MVVQARGYGFIRTDDHQDFFFNVRDVASQLPVIANERRKDMTCLIGKPVEFSPIANSVASKSPRATQVRILA